MTNLIQKHRGHLRKMAKKGACVVIDAKGKLKILKRLIIVKS